MITMLAKVLLVVCVFSSYLVDNQTWGSAQKTDTVNFSFIDQYPTAISYSSLFFALWGLIAAFMALIILSLLVGFPDTKSTISSEADDEYETNIALYMSGIGIWSAAYLVFQGHGMYGCGFLMECVYLVCAHDFYYYANSRSQAFWLRLVSSCVYALAFWSFTNVGILAFGLSPAVSLTVYALENVYLLWVAWQQRDWYIALNVIYIWLGIYLKTNGILV